MDTFGSLADDSPNRNVQLGQYFRDRNSKDEDENSEIRSAE